MTVLPQQIWRHAGVSHWGGRSAAAVVRTAGIILACALGRAADPAPEADSSVLPAKAQPETDSSSAASESAPKLGSKDLTDLSLEELMEIQVDTVYGASRYEQKLAEAPASVTVVTQDEIRKYGYRNLAEVLASIPGLWVTYDRSYRFLGTRGFSLLGDYNTRFLLLVDGHRFNDNVFDSITIDAGFPVDLDLIDRVEFIPGPGSALYGSNAFLGVINILTRRGRDFDGTEVSASAGSFGSWGGRLTYGKLFGEDLEVLASASGSWSAGQTLHFPAFQATNGGYAEDADREYTMDFFLKARLKDLTFTTSFADREKRIPTAPFETVFDTTKTFADNTRFLTDLRYERDIPNLFKLTACLFYDIYVHDSEYLYESAPPLPPFSTYINRDIGQWWGTELQISRDFGDLAKLSLGFEYRDNFAQDQKSYNDTPRITLFNSKKSSEVVGVYTQGELAPFKNLRLTAGVRYDYYTSYGSQVNPRAAIIYDPFEGTTLKALYGRAFRGPNVFELYFEAPGFQMNPSLKPETIDTFELALEQVLARGVLGSVRGYFYEIDDLITQVTDPDTGNLVYENTNMVRSLGLEAALSGRLDCGLQGRLSYSWQEANYVHGDADFINSPQHLAKLNIIYPLAADKLFAGFELQYVSRRRTLAGDWARDYVIGNLTLHTQKLLEGLEVSASVYNLFNTSYGDPAPSDYEEDILDQDGISFRLKLTYRF